MGDVTDITLQTERLTLRPLCQGDWRALSERCGVPEVADNLLSIDAPWPKAVGFAGRIENFGFGYFLAPEHWGKGYGTEAARAFLHDAFVRFDIPAFKSAAFKRNPASQNILHKLGFEQVGSFMSPATATLEPEPELLYRLTESQFKAANP